MLGKFFDVRKKNFLKKKSTQKISLNGPNIYGFLNFVESQLLSRLNSQKDVISMVRTEKGTRWQNFKIFYSTLYSMIWQEIK